MTAVARFLEVTGRLQEALRLEELAEVLCEGACMLVKGDAAGVQWSGPQPFSRTVGDALPAPAAHATGFVCPAEAVGQLALLVIRRERRFTRGEHDLLDALHLHVVQVLARVLKCEGHVEAMNRAVECLAGAKVGILFRTAHDQPLRSAGPFTNDLLTAHASDLTDLLRRITARLGAIDAQTGRRTTQWSDLGSQGTLRFRLAAAVGGEVLLVEEVEREPKSPSLKLSPRQSEVLQWMDRGKSYPEIAAILGLSLNTVHEHVAALFRRLGVSDRSAAVRRFRGEVDSC